MLRWFAYFKEAVTESAEEQYRIRRVTILYYLQDDTLEVTEPKQENSGILQVKPMRAPDADCTHLDRDPSAPTTSIACYVPQGTFIKRHRIPRKDGAPYKAADLVVGTEVVMYGRTFYIVGIDTSTRCYLEGLGISMAADEIYPQSPYDIRHASHSIGTFFWTPIFTSCGCNHSDSNRMLPCHNTMFALRGKLPDLFEWQYACLFCTGNPIRTAALEGTKSGSKGSLRFLEDANKVCALLSNFLHLALPPCMCVSLKRFDWIGGLSRSCDST